MPDITVGNDAGRPAYAVIWIVSTPLPAVQPPIAESAFAELIALASVQVVPSAMIVAANAADGTASAVAMACTRTLRPAIPLNCMFDFPRRPLGTSCARSKRRATA